MTNNKRVVSFILALLMILTALPLTVFANTNEDNQKDKNVVNGTLKGDKLVFKVLETKSTSPKKPKDEAKKFQMRSMAFDDLELGDEIINSAVRSSGQTINQKIAVSLITLGLNGEENRMSPDLLTSGLEIKLFFKMTGQGDDSPVASKEITVQKNGTLNTELEIPAEIGAGVLYAEIQNPNSNVNIRLLKGADSTTDTRQVDENSTWDFGFEVMEIVHPLVKLVAKDPYGQDVQVGNLKVKFNNKDLEVPFELSTMNPEYNLKNNKMFDPETGDGDINELNVYDSSNPPKLEVEGETGDETSGYKVTLDGVEYKVNKEYDYTKGGTITLTSQPDAIVPPTKPGSKDPVELADGYIRLTFDANEKVKQGDNGIKGTHTQGIYREQEKAYIDVKENTDYGNQTLKKLIGELKVEGKKEQKTYTQDKNKPWDPAVDESGPVASAKTYNAVYEKSIADKIEEAGGLKGK
ncbi:hypothetical protein HMPREF3189_00732, partial [Clostridiales bacterium KA00134]